MLANYTSKVWFDFSANGLGRQRAEVISDHTQLTMAFVFLAVEASSAAAVCPLLQSFYLFFFASHPCK